MPIKLEFGGIELTGDPREPTLRDQARKAEGSVRIGVIGDLRGRGRARYRSNPTQTRAERRILRVDRDNLDEVLARLGPELSLTLPEAEGTPIVLTFREARRLPPRSDPRPSRGLCRAPDPRAPPRRPGHVRRGRRRDRSRLPTDRGLRSGYTTSAGRERHPCRVARPDPSTVVPIDALRPRPHPLRPVPGVRSWSRSPPRTSAARTRVRPS